MLFTLLIALLIFAPLAYGTTGPVATLIVQAGCFAGLLWVCAEAARGRRTLYRPPGLIPLGVLGLLMLGQLLPLPSFLLELTAPATWQRYADTIWLLRPGAWMPLTVNPQRTLEALLTFSACTALYIFACQVLAEARPQARAVWIVSLFASLYALVAILESLVPNGQILWVLNAKPAYAGQPFGSFVNGNHYAGLMGMLLPVVIALFFAERPLPRYGSLRQRTIDFFTDPRLDKQLLAGMGALLIAISIFLSLSRGGILSTLGAFLVFSLLLFWREQGHRRALIMLIFVVVLFFAIGMFGWQRIFDDFAAIRNLQGEIADSRLVYWRDGLALWRDFPLFGSGFGSFLDSYPGYQTVYHGDRIVDHAHNDYLELLTDGGLLGVLLAGLSLTAVLRRVVPALRRRRKASAVLLAFGCFTGLLSLFLHSLTDFNLHIGANSLYFAFLVSLLVAAATTSSQKGGRSELPVLVRPWRRALLAIAVLGLTAVPVFHGGGLAAQASLARFAEAEILSMPQPEREQALDAARRATRLAPLEARYRLAEANLLAAAVSPRESLEAYAGAVARRPLAAPFLKDAGYAVGLAGDRETQGRLLASALRLNRTDLPSAQGYAAWLLEEGRRREAFEVIRAALQMVPDQATDFLTQMAMYGVDWADMPPALPDRSRSWSLYAEYLDRLGLEELAEQGHRRAVRLVAGDPAPSLAPYWSFEAFLNGRQRHEEALSLLMSAVPQFSANADLQARIGAQLERQGYALRAAEFYRKALLLQPRMGWVRQKLERLENP